MFDKCVALCYNALVLRRKNMKQYLSIGILMELADKGYMTAKKLANKFEISTRTVYRYLNEFESAGIPTECKRGRGGGVCIIKNATLENMLLTPQDKLLLQQAISTLPMDDKQSLSQKLRLENS